ncbi:MAG: hypothetical protein SGPRY_014420, partial [Prymnesium sp.]
ICSNGRELFDVKVGQFWRCNFDERRFNELGNLLLQPPVPRTLNPYNPWAAMDAEGSVGRRTL